MKKKKSVITNIELDLYKVRNLSPCTVWIPNKYENFINKRLLIHKKFNRYINHLIKKFSHRITNGELKPYSEVKTKYQEKGLGFKKVRFRMFWHSDWSVLKILANSLNVSRCLLISILIKFDMVDENDDIEKIHGLALTLLNNKIGYREIYSPRKELLIRTIIQIYSPIYKYFQGKWVVYS